MADQELQVSNKAEVSPDHGELTHEGTYFTPAVDIYETEKELVLLADMPGVDAANLDIDLKDDTLSIVGKVESGPEDGTDLLAEYNVGNFFRNFHIADVVDQNKITATMADGVLRLVLPKAEKAVPRKIPISTD
jgi:HSP20 family protein